MDPMIGAIEAGGTKVVLAVGRAWRDVRDAQPYVIATTTPRETLDRVTAWLRQRDAETPLGAIGVASFGPVDLTRSTITNTTPKIPWRGVSWSEVIEREFGALPMGIDTDTGAAALAEFRFGAGRGKDVVVYLTIGTGIGGGLVVGGRVVHGLLHPELGHMVVARRAGDDFAGSCPLHGDCLEGLASGVAVSQRWRHEGGSPLAPTHVAWELESEYLADAVRNVVTITAAQVVILGGGIMSVPGLLGRIREKVRDSLNGYLAVAQLTNEIDAYIVAPGLGASAGVVGAFTLGADALA